jgi:hypothetical protein
MCTHADALKEPKIMLPGTNEQIWMPEALV